MTTTGSGLAIRPMTQLDLDGVVRLEAATHANGWSRSVFESELARGSDRRYLVAVQHGRLVGYVGVLLVVDEAHLTTVVVEPGRRRRGVGRALVARALELAEAMGATAATLEVRPSNDAARALYRGFGFAPVGVRPGYYADTGEDALIMWLHGLGAGRSIDGRS